MKRSMLLLPGFLITCAANNGWAGFVIGFEGLQNKEQILNYYDAGTGSLGSGPGPSLGITFSSNFVAIVGQGPFDPAPPFGRVGLLAGPSAIMDVTGGFTGPFSLYYISPDNFGAVTVWSGLDGTGMLIGSFALPAATTFFSPAGTTFPGTARSVVFNGTPNTIRFDNLTSGGFVIPEPSTSLLVFSALALGGIFRALCLSFRRSAFLNQS